jgi:hypothetical protein
MSDSLEIFDTDFSIIIPNVPPKIDTNCARKDSSDTMEKHTLEGQNAKDIDYKHLRRESSLTEVVEILNAVEQAKFQRRKASSSSDENNVDDDYETYFSETDMFSPNMTPGNSSPENVVSSVSSNEIDITPRILKYDTPKKEIIPEKKKYKGLKYTLLKIKNVFKKNKSQAVQVV